MDINLQSIQSAAKEAENILAQVMKVEPAIASTVGVFVPEVAVAQPIVLALAPAIENALNAVVAGNGGNLIDAVGQLFKHLLPGQPNAAALAPTVPEAVATATGQSPG